MFICINEEKKTLFQSFVVVVVIRYDQPKFHGSCLQVSDRRKKMKVRNLILPNDEEKVREKCVEQNVVFR